jgi:hypothetical protein
MIFSHRLRTDQEYQRDTYGLRPCVMPVYYASSDKDRKTTIYSPLIYRYIYPTAESYITFTASLTDAGQPQV